MERSHRYDDIIDLPHHVSDKHPQMPLAERAAQFSPFAALTGYEDAIGETARQTETKRELSDEERQHISSVLHELKSREKSSPAVTVTFYRPDARKPGGAYDTVTGRIKKVNVGTGRLELRDGTKIYFDDVFSIWSLQET
ncbi:MAG: hypothetical protein IKE62_03010 [Oscillospiraceae bacterium]|nr:hypothetical protein [Oscillospiraceae bacterium]